MTNKLKKVVSPKKNKELNKKIASEINQNEEFLKMKVIQLGDECESYVREKEKLRGLLTERDIEINRLRQNHIKSVNDLTEYRDNEVTELKRYNNNCNIGNTILFTLIIWLSFLLYIKW